MYVRPTGFASIAVDALASIAVDALASIAVDVLASIAVDVLYFACKPCLRSQLVISFCARLHPRYHTGNRQRRSLSCSY
eukprot:6182523-Pleurochrysis_carterae.AAC.3